MPTVHTDVYIETYKYTYIMTPNLNNAYCTHRCLHKTSYWIRLDAAQ